MVTHRRDRGFSRLTSGEKTFDIINTIILLFMSFLFIYPFWYVLILSLNEGQDAIKGGIYWWPRVFSIGNYAAVLRDKLISRAFFISVLRTLIGTVSSITVTLMAAFGLSRNRLRGRNVFLTIFFITMLFSGGLIPFYLLLIDLNLINKFAVFILPSLFSVWNMIVMKTSIKNNIHESIIESAKIDGAGYARIFFQIVIPLSMPMIAAISLFVAVHHWNDWFTGAFYITDHRMQPLQTYLQRILNSSTATEAAVDAQEILETQLKLYNPAAITTRSMRMATIMVATIPILTVYPFLQRFFVKGVMIGSVKG